jgi:hypothetical protein
VNHRKLATDFVHTAKSLGKIIISEKFIPREKRTIREHCNVGGIAGGEKYIHHGILFKFAYDRHNIYRTDHNAMKAAGHELKGVMRYGALHTHTHTHTHCIALHCIASLLIRSTTALDSFDSWIVAFMFL